MSWLRLIVLLALAIAVMSAAVVALAIVGTVCILALVSPPLADWLEERGW